GVPTSGDYTAFGNTTRKGFTGHEMLDSVALVHMSGRVYDPWLGRFTSADTAIQSLGATESINPYAYAWNDPLKYIDPSGHSLLGDIIGAIVGIALAYFTFGIANAFLASEYVIGASVYASAIAGFVGGFVGAAIATGSLSAALTAGLISGVTAGLFNVAGSAFAGNSSWEISERALAHAFIGCASAAASSGNCGKGALAAAVSEGANSTILKGNEFAQWGSDGQLAARTALSGLIGGAAARIVGGTFVEGFSIAAAGYLYNSWQHRYDYRSQVCSNSDEACSTSAAWDALKHNAYPGQDSSTTVENGGRYLVFGYQQTGAITVYVDDANMTIANVTEPTHEFCCGRVVLQITSDDNGVYLNVTGTGSNPTWLNKLFNLGASLAFPALQAPNVSYQIDYSFYQRTGGWPRGSGWLAPGEINGP
ncbi:MAG: RHS repeat-associated core domain-containing protein, partial [Steroidobacteraceae bacterium]